MLNLILPLLIGILAGTFTGLIPGIHINLVAISVLSISLILNLPLNALIIFIIAMAITHTFMDFIPSVFLGAPDEDTAIGVMPGHELLKQGEGHRAVKLTVVGSTLAILSLILIVPFFLLIMPKIYPLIERMMAFILIWVSIFLIYNEKDLKLKTIIIFILAGFLGFSSLNLNTPQPILPLLTGLFGTSTIIYSIKSKTKIPKQNIGKLDLNKKDLIKPTLATILVSPICSLLPGLGSSQAAVIGSEITGKLNREQFLILLGSVNTLVMSVSFVTLFLFQKNRTGAAAAISQLTRISTNELIIILATILASTIIIIPLTIYVSKIISKHIHKIPYSQISYTILIFLIFITIYFSGFFGLIILIVSTLLGLTAIEWGIRRSFLMGAILIPTIIYYLPF